MMKGYVINMTEQEIATYAETYINNVTSSAQSFCWCYFLAGFIFCIFVLYLINFVCDSVCKIIEKHKQNSKKEEVEK